MRIKVLTLVMALWVPAAQAQDTELNTGLATPVKLGEAPVRFLGRTVYAATLYTEGSEQFSWSQPLSLRLDYAYGFTAAQLVKATGREIARIEGPRPDQADLLAKLTPCFRDVGPGDSYVAVATTADQLSLRLSGQKTCDVTHQDVRRRFLNIWLSPDSQFPRLSNKLRGG